ncbi:alkaline phosphatase PafA [Aureibacter tunicatorum]|uniref:AlkP superfamily pyrophosphatase or phosphodiesterase n=1 Tax=Aureibacter tunicatorum TaxID=866807 RepID=A0AAE3XLB1_9BACT|nr:alkaline phosphatase PafA [Aureibacter tunicatorum]MDR6238698.1 putative AlkP superfamily pyrophosphatase or phosphodiesterase [Aureibacter tunicatorum]
MKKTSIFSIIFLLAITQAFAQEKKPKLVVGIIVDQMRQEYLYRYEEHLSEDGFKRLIKDGFELKNTHYNYVPTSTGPGHASVYSGTTPTMHGIVANDWYSRQLQGDEYCAYDPKQKAVGTDAKGGDRSPENLMTTTITDELKISTLFESKVIGVSLKDRGAILPAGHSADAAYWYDTKSGNFITSTYYMDELPKWVQDFNKKKLAEKYLQKTWNTVLPISEYTASLEDNNPYEHIFKGKSEPVFPYNLKKLSKENGGTKMLPLTPYGNDIVNDMAIATIENEKMGQGKVTDFLAVSYSSTDKIGHAFGPQSIEVQDTYLRLDQNIADLLKKLDEKVGKGNYLVFLTADHAAVEVPQFLVDHKMPGGYFDDSNLINDLNIYVSQRVGKGDWIEAVSERNVFINYLETDHKKVDRKRIQDLVSEYLISLEGIDSAYPAYILKGLPYDEHSLKGHINRGYNQKRSGDVIYSLQSGWLASDKRTGTSHGCGFTYDTHVPLIWYGWNVPQGSSNRLYKITQIAPTLSQMLEIKVPSGCTFEPIYEITE